MGWKVDNLKDCRVRYGWNIRNARIAKKNRKNWRCARKSVRNKAPLKATPLKASSQSMQI